MKLLTKETLPDKPYKNLATGLFLPDKEIVDKLLAILGYSNPLPENLAIHYYALAGKDKIVVETYLKEEWDE